MSAILLLASPQGGEAERSRKCREVSACQRGRGGFPIETKRKTTPAASASVASPNFINDAATPCRDARRGIGSIPILATSPTVIGRYSAPARLLVQSPLLWALHKKYIAGARRAPLQLRTPSCRGA